MTPLSAITFLAGSRLWLFAVVGALVALYAVAQSRRRRYAVRFTNLPLLSSVAPRRPGWRRHLPALALVVGLAALVTALARPARPQRIAKERATIMMVVDVSLSMQATDVRPSRIESAKVAARSFVDNVPRGVNLGLIQFAENTEVLVPPTGDYQSVSQAIGQLSLGPGTAIGDAIFSSLRVIDAQPKKDGKRPPSRVLLMSDGKTTVGRSNESASRAAAEAKVPVSTIAYGTEEGVLTYQGESIAVPVAKEPLRDIAGATGGKYYEAASAEEIKDVYKGLGSSIGSITRKREATTWFLGLGLAFVLGSAVTSLIWSPRMP